LLCGFFALNCMTCLAASPAHIPTATDAAAAAVLYTTLLFPVVSVANTALLGFAQRRSSNSSFVRDTTQQQQQQQFPPTTWSRQPWLILTSVAVAAMAYCYSFYVATIAAAFNCMQLGPKHPTVPGEIRLLGRYWVPDMQLQCWSGSHFAVMLFALLGELLLLVYLWLLLVLAWPHPQGSSSSSKGEASTAGAAAAAVAAEQVSEIVVRAQAARRQGRFLQEVAENVSFQQQQQQMQWRHQAQQHMTQQQDYAAVSEGQQQQVLRLTVEGQYSVTAAAPSTAAAAVTQQPGQVASAAAAAAAGAAEQRPHAVESSGTPTEGKPTATAAAAAATSNPSWAQDYVHCMLWCCCCSWLWPEPNLAHAWLATCSSSLLHLQQRLILLPVRLLGPAVARCQAYTAAAGIDGQRCAGLGVWNVHWRWWWMPVNELVKLVIVTTASVSTMRAPQVQALLVLLLIVAAMCLTWLTQSGCSTSMNRMQFAGWCWLQLLALMVLLLVVPHVRGEAVGGVLLGLVLLLMCQYGVVLGGLVVRCVTAARKLSTIDRGLVGRIGS
jgi:hypothetical protein